MKEKASYTVVQVGDPEDDGQLAVDLFVHMTGRQPTKKELADLARSVEEHKRKRSD